MCTIPATYLAIDQDVLLTVPGEHRIRYATSGQLAVTNGGVLVNLSIMRELDLCSVTLPLACTQFKMSLPLMLTTASWRPTLASIPVIPSLVGQTICTSGLFRASIRFSGFGFTSSIAIFPSVNLDNITGGTCEERR